MLLKPSDRLVLIGDSITEWGRPRPQTPEYATALGHGYVAMVASMLKSRVPGMEVLNRGIGGNTVRDLEARWTQDVLALRPRWVSVMIGINDVWRYFDPLRRSEAVPPDEYEHALDRLVAQTLAPSCGVVLLTPFYVEADRSEPMRARMDAFGAIVRKVAERHRTRFADTQAAIDRLLTLHAPEAVAHDRVHVGMAGHEAIAEAFLAAVEG